MSRLLLLDTCAAIWTTDPDARFSKAEAGIEAMVAQGAQVLVSPITAWEVGQLVSRGRLSFSRDPEAWFADLLDRRVQLAALSPQILVRSSFLPSPRLRDPADRIIASTARVLGCTVVTRDAALLAYAAQGEIAALPC